jgi:thiol-disulfide isomerase/thioredoxin
MKKIIFLFLSAIAILLASCKGNSYSIDGKFSDNSFDGETIYLQKLDSMDLETITVIDSVAIKDGKFTLKGTTDEPVMGFISVGKLKQATRDTPVATVILEPGTINMVFDKTNVTFGGTPKNDEFNKILVVENQLTNRIYDITPEDAGNSVVKEEIDTLQKELQKLTFNFAKANISNKAGKFLLYSSAQVLTKEQLNELIAASDTVFQNRDDIKALVKALNRVKPEIGNPYSDAQLIDLEGSVATLSQYVGENRLVLIDFWASWCQPCIQEMPVLIKVYNTYKPKGLEIVGISVDDDKNKWINSVKTNKMTWVQLADASTMASQLYEVGAIPHTVLIDENGIVIAKDLRGKELENKIAEILK